MNEKPVNGIVLFPNGTHERRQFKQLSDYQSAVGGYVEALRLYDHTYEKEVACMYVDEEGRLKEGAKINSVAGGISFLLNSEDYLLGNAVLVGASDSEGYDTDIPDWLVAFVNQVSRDVTPNV